MAPMMLPSEISTNRELNSVLRSMLSIPFELDSSNKPKQCINFRSLLFRSKYSSWAGAVYFVETYQNRFCMAW